MIPLIFTKLLSLRRKVRMKLNLPKKIFFSMIALLIIVFGHSALISHFEKINLFDAFWLTMTTITTTGYGDFYAKTVEGRLTTIVLLYLVGIYLLSNVLVFVVDFLGDRNNKIKNGLWRWKMKSHLVILGSPDKDADVYFKRIFNQIRLDGKLENKEILVVFNNKDVFNQCAELCLKYDIKSNVLKMNSQDCMDIANIKQADFVFVLSDDHSDSRAFDLISRVRETNPSCFLITEAIEDENIARLKRAGATSVIRPMRSYPEMVIRAINAPGSEDIIVNLFDSEGDECVRFDFPSMKNMKWGDIIVKLTSNEIGLPLALLNENNIIITNPKFKDVFDIKALFIIMKDEQQLSYDVAYINKILRT